MQDDGKIVTFVTIVITGATGFFFNFLMWWANRRERLALIKEKEANAKLTGTNIFEKIQGMYGKLMNDLEKREAERDLEMGQMREEIKMLRSIIDKKNEKCKTCPTNKGVVAAKKRRKR